MDIQDIFSKQPHQNNDTVQDFDSIKLYLENPESFFTRFINSLNTSAQIETVSISGAVHIGENTIIKPYTVIEGPVFIGDNVTIGPHVYIRPYSVLADNTVVGNGSELKHVWVGANSKIASLCFVGDSVIGQKAHVGSGTITTNRRFDQSPVSVYDNSIIAEKIGVLLGDFSRLGGACATAPGTIIGQKTWVTTGCVVSHDIEAKQFVTMTQAGLKKRLNRYYE